MGKGQIWRRNRSIFPKVLAFELPKRRCFPCQMTVLPIVLRCNFCRDKLLYMMQHVRFPQMDGKDLVRIDGCRASCWNGAVRLDLLPLRLILWSQQILWISLFSWKLIGKSATFVQLGHVSRSYIVSLYRFKSTGVESSASRSQYISKNHRRFIPRRALGDVRFPYFSNLIAWATFSSW